MMDERERRPAYRFNESRMELTYPCVWIEEEDDDMDVTVPAKFEVCHVCDGKGTHVNPSIDSHGLTGEDFAEDPDFAEDYFGGTYDVTCNWCGGRRVEPVMDEDRTSLEVIKVIHQHEANVAAYERQCEHERRVGA